MRILVLSDSHGCTDPMMRAVECTQPDQIIHLGDVHRDCEALVHAFPNIPVYGVCGNCDHGGSAPERYIDTVEGIKIFACHGHAYSVKRTLLHLYYAAMECGAVIALYGHTHIAKNENLRGIQFLNPGACYGTHPSCGIITIENGKAVCEIYPL